VLAQRRPGLARYLHFEDELMAVVSAFLEHVSLASGAQRAAFVGYWSTIWTPPHVICTVHCTW